MSTLQPGVETVEIPYAPRSQLWPYHRRTQRWAVLVTHRGYGKTVGVINDVIKRCALGPQGARYAYIAPYRVQAKAIAWTYLKRYVKPIMGTTCNESELSVMLPGDRKISLYGADNFDALRGLHLHGCVIDESEQVSKEAFDDVLNYCLMAHQGWCTWIGTIKGSKGLYRQWDQARNDPTTFTLFLKASESGVFTQAQLEEDKRRNPVKHAREMELDPNAEIAGSIYGRWMSDMRSSNRIRNISADNEAPMYTFWDLGHSDYTAIWLIQLVGRDILILDYYCNQGQLASHYADRMVMWTVKWGKPIAINFLPHDASRVASGGATWEENLHAGGLLTTDVVERIDDEWIGINYLRALLPRCYIHQGNCGMVQGGDLNLPSGIDCLDYFHGQEVTSKGVIRDKTVHDHHSHGAAALRLFAEAEHGGMIPGTTKRDRRPPEVIKGRSGADYGRKPTAGVITGRQEQTFGARYRTPEHTRGN